jgi:vitamin B12 transport system substrate-binding protein
MPLRLTLLWLALWAPAARALRLATTSPQVTELVFDLGKGSDLVAVSAFSQYPPEAARLPVLGGLFLPSIERVVTVRAEALAFDQMNASPAFAQAAEALGIRRYEFAMTSVDSLLSDSKRFLKEAYGEESSPRLDRLSPCVLSYRPHGKFKFLALTWVKPPIAFGERTFLSDVLTRLGGENLLANLGKSQFPQLSVEWILARSPDYVFYLTEFPESVEEVRATLAHWWPKKTPPLVLLPADQFARGGFSPLRAADTLPVTSPKTGWKECLEAK